MSQALSISQQWLEEGGQVKHFWSWWIYAQWQDKAELDKRCFTENLAVCTLASLKIVIVQARQVNLNHSHTHEHLYGTRQWDRRRLIASINSYEAMPRVPKKHLPNHACNVSQLNLFGR